MIDDLSNLSAAEIDSLPFGYIALGPDGTVRKYNRYEADLARKNPQEVLGKNFFREVAPCTRVREFEGRFQDFVAGRHAEATLSFDFEFAFRHGSQKVRIGMVRSPLSQEVIVTVNRVRDLRLAMSAELRPEPTRGLVFDASGRPVVIAGGDFFASLDALIGGYPEAQQREMLHRLGKEWAMQHALRVELFVQREQGLTLREVELQVALESFSGSLGTLGLGRFDVDLGYRSRGLLVAIHHDSPFEILFASRDGQRNGLLAGLHAGFLSYLAGRSLVGRELGRPLSPGQPCRFVVGTENRLSRLFEAAEGSADADLLVSLGGSPRVAVVTHG
jgi:photoactive yellow protein